jgi:anti-sigma-K factor RskA
MPLRRPAGRKASKRAEHDELLELREEVAEHRRLLSEMLAERKAAAIEPEMLARLIRLCHPDKHGNGSEASTTATQWLLAQREART